MTTRVQSCQYSTLLSKAIAFFAVSLLLFSLLFFAHIVFKTAWICDDAFITFRTIENFYSGIGLTWNPHERVQTYTHPAWMLLLLVGRLFSEDLYTISLVLSFGILAGLFLVLSRFFVKHFGSIHGLLRLSIVLFFLLCSKAFVDFSTSGLENVLSYLFFGVFFCILCSEQGEARTKYLYLLIGGLLLIRHDFFLIVLPIAFFELLFGVGTLRKRFVYACYGAMLPLAWTVFSLVYYGFPFPNTAYAKLAGGVSRELILQQGIEYYRNSLLWDPVTLSVIGVALFVAFLKGKNHHRFLASGIVLYLVYVLYIGGDFMSGRFFTVPYLLATLFLSSLIALPYSLLLLLIGLVVSAQNKHSPMMAEDHYLGYPYSRGIADERGFYYRMTGLKYVGDDVLETIQPYLDGLAFRNSDDIFVRRDAFGFFGYAAGPHKIVHDNFALSSPFLARLPSEVNDFRAGHVPRTMSRSFIASEVRGANLLKRPRLRKLYGDLAIITRGPIWSWQRWELIVTFLFANGGAPASEVDRETPENPEKPTT